jgi:hypothetical protein
LREVNVGLALWSLILGAAASFATFQHGGYETLLFRSSPIANDPVLPSQVDPAGLATFLAVGIATLLFRSTILRSDRFPRGLGTLGMVNGILLILHYLATVINV